MFRTPYPPPPDAPAKPNALAAFQATRHHVLTQSTATKEAQDRPKPRRRSFSTLAVGLFHMSTSYLIIAKPGIMKRWQ